MPWVVIIAAFIGASAGSLINVLALRFRVRAAKLTDRSRCSHCRTELSWWELVPVISFLALRGQCAHCHHKILWQYPAVETLTAMFWIWAFLPWPQQGADYVAAASTAGILSVLLLLFLIDMRSMILPDIYILYLAIFVLLRLWAQPPEIPQAQITGAGAGAGFLLLLWAVTAGRGIGFGDIKLMIPLGLLFGLTATVALLWVAFVAGGIVAAYLLLVRRATMKTAVPFGPFLIGASAVLLMWPHLSQLLFAPFAV